jgi:hypothetical protein
VSSQQFECMFCGESIDGDPLQVALVRQSDAGKPDAPNASYWAHLACLRERVHPATRDYLLVWEPDSNLDTTPPGPSIDFSHENEYIGARRGVRPQLLGGGSFVARPLR